MGKSLRGQRFYDIVENHLQEIGSFLEAALDIMEIEKHIRSDGGPKWKGLKRIKYVSYYLILIDVHTLVTSEQSIE